MIAPILCKVITQVDVAAAQTIKNVSPFYPPTDALLLQTEIFGQFAAHFDTVEDVIAIADDSNDFFSHDAGRVRRIAEALWLRPGMMGTNTGIFNDQSCELQDRSEGSHLSGVMTDSPGGTHVNVNTHMEY